MRCGRACRRWSAPMPRPTPGPGMRTCCGWARWSGRPRWRTIRSCAPTAARSSACSPSIPRRRRAWASASWCDSERAPGRPRKADETGSCEAACRPSRGSRVIRQADFFLEGDRRGVLLIHGLTGTPMEMRLLGKGLNNAGFTVHGMQLAGHCGDTDDLLATGWRDWYASVEQAADALLAKVDQLFVGGLSMGALLALKLAADRPGQVAGVGVYGATFRYDGWSIPWLARLSFLLPFAKKVGLGRNRVFLEQPPYGLRDERLREQVSAAMRSGDSTIAG